MSDRSSLARDTILDDKYRIDRVIGVGGFAVTYAAEHLALHRTVAIKEFFPVGIAQRRGDGSVGPRHEADRAGFEQLGASFIKEARTLIQFDHPAIVRVLNIFEANGTVYLVMRFEDGPNLKAWRQDLGRAPTRQEIEAIVRPLLGALDLIHAAHYLHRDIAPDNIILRDDGSPVLVDFGAARPVMSQQTAHVTGIVKRGFSPPEQYSSDSRVQGPWTDIYALAGTLYQVITGHAPQDATARMLADEHRPALDLAAGNYPEPLLSAIDWGLRLQPDERPQSIAEWREAFVGAFPKTEPSIVPQVPVERPLPEPIQTAPSAPLARRPDASSRSTTLSALTLSMLLVAAGVAWWFTSVPPPPVPREETPRPSGPRPIIDSLRGTFRDCPQCPEMVIVPAGQGLMGSPATETGRRDNEGPQRLITFARPFAMARFEATRGEWRAFALATQRARPNDCRALQFDPARIDDYESGRTRADWASTGVNHWDNTGYAQDDTHPAACISYTDAEDYLGWLTARAGAPYRLPSEAEWEYAARAGTTTAFAFGDTIGPENASYHHPSAYRSGQTGRWLRGTSPVGSFTANRLGLGDMHGNVWEWVADCADSDLAAIEASGRAYQPRACAIAGMRGGAFWTDPSWLRSAFRYRYQKDLRGAAAGFRAVREIRDDEHTHLQPLIARAEAAVRGP